MIILKDHNVKPYAQLCEMLATHQKCAYIAATGTGKSYVVGKYIEDHDLVDKTLVLVPSKAIKDAWEKLLPGLMVITYQSLLSGENDFSWAVLIVCDEMHHLGAAEWGKVYQKAIQKINCKLIGITATPIRFLDQGRNMAEEYFDSNYVEGLDLPGAISAGILPGFDYITALFDLPSRRPSEKGRNAYTERLFQRLDFMSSEYSFKNILRKHLDAGSHKVAVFTNHIENVGKVKKLIADVYPEAEHFEVHSGKKYSAKSAMAEFAASKGMSFVYTVDMLNEGVHINGVDCVIMFRKTESPTVYLQQLGRALANDMAGRRIKIFDFVANHRNLKAIQGGSGSVIEWIQGEITNPQYQIAVSDYALEELKLLEKLSGMIRGYWTPDEDEVLRLLYDKGRGVAAVMKALPHREKTSIYSRAGKLGLTDDAVVYDYPDGFFEDLRELYEQPDGLDALTEKYPQFSRQTFIRWANKMGMTRNKPAQWTAEQDQMLKENADKSMDELLILFPAFTKGVIRTRIQNLGLQKFHRNYWTDEKDAILESNQNLTAKELQEKFFPEISLSSINSRRRKKFNSHGSRGFWTKEHQEQFIEAYQKGGAREVLKNPEFRGINKTTLNGAAIRYGVSYRKPSAKWSEEEIEIIESYLDTPESEREPMDALVKKIPSRSCSAIKQRKAKIEQQRKEAEANGTDTENTGAAVPTDTKAEA